LHTQHWHPCMKDSSSLGIQHCLGQDATKTNNDTSIIANPTDPK